MPIVTVNPPAPALQPTIAPLRPGPDIDVPQTLFIDRVSPCLRIDWPAVCKGYSGGAFNVPLDPATRSEILDVKRFRRISVNISGTKGTAGMLIGKIEGTTLADRLPVPVDGCIHSFDVTGPQIMLYISGSASLGVEDVRLWLYLRS